jgi:hypothetical protein
VIQDVGACYRRQPMLDLAGVHGYRYTVAITHETSIVLALFLSKTLNVLGLLFVNLGEVSASILLCA